MLSWAVNVQSAWLSSLTVFSLVIIHPVVKNWLKYAKFEEKNQYISSARRIYERAVEYFGDEHLDETLMVAFAKFEESQREVGCWKLYDLLCGLMVSSPITLWLVGSCSFNSTSMHDWRVEPEGMDTRKECFKGWILYVLNLLAWESSRYIQVCVGPSTKREMWRNLQTLHSSWKEIWWPDSHWRCNCQQEEIQIWGGTYLSISWNFASLCFSFLTVSGNKCVGYSVALRTTKHLFWCLIQLLLASLCEEISRKLTALCLCVWHIY